MTITGEALITDAARAIGVIASDQALETAEKADGLIVLNKLVDSWSAELITLVQLSTTAIVLGAGMGPHTTPRPIKIKSASCAAATGTTIMPVDVISVEAFDAIQKFGDTAAVVKKMVCDYTHPTANLYVWPAAVGATLTLRAYMELAQFTLLSTSLSLPPGYARGLTLNLAVDLAELFGRPVTQTLLQSAAEAKAAIVATNARILGDAPPPAQPQGVAA